MNLPVFIELHVPSFDPLLEFYSKLEFIVARREENYLVLKHDALVMAFYGGNAGVTRHSYFSRFPEGSLRGYGVEIVIGVRNIEKIYSQFVGTTALITPLQPRSWGKHDFRLADPFGFYLRITEPVDPAAPL